MTLTDRTTAKAALPSKITPPEVGLVFARPALLDRLAELSATVRRIWISSPGGAGKTTLVRSFLASDQRPLVWYHVDAEDRDPANLFFYLTQTAPDAGSGQKPMPQLTPEYTPNPAAFCRNFFRTYFARYVEGCVLVFDDFQEGPGGPFFGLLLAAAMAELPANSALFVLSREEPCASLARQRINRSLAHIKWEDLRLNADETHRFLSWALNAEPSRQETERAHSLTQGWLTGLLLYLENPTAEPIGQHLSFERTELLFDYFATESFEALPVGIQSLLVTCALLPTIHVDMAQRLTGQVDAGEMLSALVRGNHFVFRISGSANVYRFHPLFRQFLQARAAREWTTERTNQLRVQAAGLLLGAGQVEASAELLIAACAWPELIGLVAGQANVLLGQARTRTLLEWLRALPDDLRRHDPWLLYWYGCCINAESPLEARGELSHAFELFETTGDSTGSMLAWATTVYSIVVGGDRLAELDAWIERFERLRERYPEYPSPDIEAQMVQAVCQALSWRQPWHRDWPVWARRLRELVTESRDKRFRILAGADVMMHYTAMGDLASVRAVAAMLEPDLLSDDVAPLQKLIWLAMRSFTETLVIVPAEHVDLIRTARAIIAESGIDVASARLFGSAIPPALNSGNLRLAREYFDEWRMVPVVSNIDQFFLFYVHADLCSMEGDSSQAVVLAEMAAAKAEASGSPVALVLAFTISTVVLEETGQRQGAREILVRGRLAATGMPHFQCFFNLMDAYFELTEGHTDAAHQLLEEAFGFAARRGTNFHPWRDEIMSRLCREAIRAGIEVEYARRLAASHGLALRQGAAPNLTPRELQILNWLIAGKTNGEIALIQGVSERTAKFHVGNILHKLGANSRTHAVSIALGMGLKSEG